MLILLLKYSSYNLIIKMGHVMNFKLKIIALLITLIAFSGCSYNPFIENNQLTGTAAGAVVGGVIGAGGLALIGAPKALVAVGGVGGAAIGYYTTTLRYVSGGVIQTCGAVYKVGDNIGIYIPTDLLFEPNSDELLDSARPILDSAAAILKRYPQNNILISGSTSGFGFRRFEQCLSEKRAQKIAAYLWSVGVSQCQEFGTSKHKLTYIGYGDYFPIASDLRNEGIRQNSRIQILSYPSKRDLLIPPAADGQVFKNYAGL